jgi:hypothetical protein
MLDVAAPARASYRAYNVSPVRQKTTFLWDRPYSDLGIKKNYSDLAL